MSSLISSCPTHPVRPQSLRTSLATVTLAAIAGIALPLHATDAKAAPLGSSHGTHEFHHRVNNVDHGGALYVMTNDAKGNAILVFARTREGKLIAIPRARVRTGGLGANTNAPVDPLGSQNSLVFDKPHAMLFAVNAGDNSVTAFDTSVPSWRPRRTAIVSSGGTLPVSLAVSEDLLYVLNAGGHGNVTTFKIDDKGKLTKIGSLELGLDNGTTIPFNNVAAPGQVGIDTLARRLIVTNGGGQQLLVSELDDDGIPTQDLTATPTTGIVPFAFDTTRFGTIVVAEAGSAAVSAFEPALAGQPLLPTAESVANGQAATCWLVVHQGGFVYVTNTASDTVSLYSYSRTGEIELLDDIAATTGGAPTDMTLAGGGRLLYTLDAGSGEISGFSVDFSTGALTSIEVESGLPASAGIQGIAARDF